MKKLFLSALAGALLLTGCASGADTPAPTDTAGTTAPETPATEGQFERREPFKIGYSVYDLQNPYWQSWTAGVKAAGEAAGAEVIVADQKSDQKAQVSGSLDLINQGVSALIITPVQPDALPATIEAAHEAKIPVVIGDIGTAGDFDAYIQSNNRDGGALAAKYVIDNAGEAGKTVKVGVIELHAGSVVGEERVSEFKTAIEAADGFELVASLDGNDTVEGGFQAATDMLSANPDLSVIYAGNDASAIGAQRALESAGKSVADGFTLIGFDGSDDALALIKEGKMSATVAQDPFGQGQAAVAAAIALLDGTDPGFSDAANRTIFFPVELVTAENLDAFTQKRANQA